MRALLRYAVCVLVTFSAAAYAFSSLFDAYYSLGIRIWLSSSDTQGGTTMRYLQRTILSVANSARCFVADGLRRCVALPE
jgi:hypothetical protein